MKSHECVAQQRRALLAAGLGGSGGSVAVALGAADEPPTTAIGDVAQLLHINMNQRSGVVVFVATNRFTGGPVAGR